MYSHILIPTDGSELAERGVDHGLALAKALRAKVTIVTVTEPMAAYASADAALGWRAALADFTKYKDAAAEALLSASKQRAETVGAVAETLQVQHANPGEAIVEAARSRDCDLIVMASHGRRGLTRLFLGSQTSEVLANSPVPVLVVGPETPPA